MLDQDIKQQFSSYMEKLQQPIRLLPFFAQSSNAQELAEFIGEIAEASALISIVSEHNYQQLPLAKFQPSFAIATMDATPRIAFAGIPMGHEFTSLVLALLQTSGYPPKISPELKEQIARLASAEQPLHFTSFISLSCHNCPDVVQALNILAALNPHISHTMVDGGNFPQEVEARQIMAVPSVFLNEQPFAQGRISLEEIINKLDVADDNSAVEQLNSKDEFDVLVIGGGPAGAAAAIYAARKGIRTGIVAERFGGQVLDTLAIENFISVSSTEGSKLVANLEAHVNDYQVDIMRGQQAIKLSKSPENAKRFEITLANQAKLRSKTVILSTGARWRELNVPGENQYRGKGVAYCPHCDGPLFKGKNIAVVGGGNSGVEAAIDLAGIVAHVTLLEFTEQLRADEVLQRKLRSLPNVKVITNAQSTEILGSAGKVSALVYKMRDSGKSKTIDLAGVFVQIGLLPNSDWLKDTVSLTRFGEIEIDARGQTSLPGVFAAGDCATTPYKQIIIAMGSGATAALSAFDYLIRHGD